MSAAAAKPVDVEELLGVARLIVRKQTPYFRPALHALVPREMTPEQIAASPGGIGVDRHAVLYYDPAYLAKIGPDALAGALVHEIEHLLKKHMQRRGDRDPLLFNVAGDLTNNPEVVQMGFQLPAGVVFPKMFGLKEGLTADEYYDLLVKQVQKQAGGEGDGQGQQVPGTGQAPGLGSGRCGGCAGHPEPHEGQGGDSQQDPQQKPNGAGGFEGRTEAQLERVGKQVAEAIKGHAAKSRGTVPAGWLRWAEEALKPPRVPWRQKLAYAVRTAVHWRAGAQAYKYDAPSKKQGGIGYGSGKPLLPRLRAPVPRVAVAVDTSGSMGEDQLLACMSELGGVLKAVGAAVTFVSCDAAVHALAPIRTLQDAKKLLKGGGGTDFRPVFDALERKREDRPEILIFATDGYGPAPAVEPRWCRTIWLLVGKGAPKPAAWGTDINVDDLE